MLESSSYSKTGSPRVWAVVLARAGSQRLPNKAMLPLSQRPMASWYFDALEHAEGLERRFLFSDDDALLNLVQDSHPQIELPPFKRPLSVSEAHTSSFESLAYFLHTWQSHTYEALPDWVMLCQCTSPLVQAEDFNAALAELHTHRPTLHSTGLLSVSAPNKPLSWLLKKTQGHVKPAPMRWHTSEESTYVTPNGAFYIVPTSALLQKPVGFSLWDLDTVLAYEMPWHRSIDIDTATDFQVAEALLNAQLNTTVSAPHESTLKESIEASRPITARKRLNPLKCLKHPERFTES
jgi:CMP-N-acetylneuraminic acid synthetase